MNSAAGRPSQPSPEHSGFLSERFQKVEGGVAAPGLRGTYAVVRQDQAVLGLVAVDDDLGIWYSPRAEDQAGLRRHGFSYSRGNLLATLYFGLPFAAPQPAASVPVVPAAAAAPTSPSAPPRMQRREEPTPAGAGAWPVERYEIEPSVAQAGCSRPHGSRPWARIQPTA